nr:MAG TPA: minor capsid component [Caudoviricetes sp.]
MWRELLRLLHEAAAQGLARGDYQPRHNDEFLNAIRHSNEVFAAFKVHAMGKAMANKLYDEGGQLKPFKQWLNDVQNISSHHVGAWLRTEYNTSVLRAHAAADWQEFVRNKDVMPNLRWMPTTSPDAEASHRSYWEEKLTLPVDHPFWEKHHPQDRWNCKCRLEATDEPVSPDDLVEDMPAPQLQRGLDNNPGKDGHLINDTHPYFPESCARCPYYKPRGAKNRLKAAFSNHKKDCFNCPYINEKLPNGYRQDEKYKERLLISNTADSKDLDSNVKVSRSLLSSFPEMTIKVRPHVLERGVSNPELEINGMLADNKMINGEKGVTAAFKKAIKQGCQVVVIDLDARLKRLNPFELTKYVHRREADFINETIKECYVVFKGKAVKITPNTQNRNEIQKALKQLES